MLRPTQHKQTNVPAYRFTTTDPAGAQASGIIQADTPRLARETLRARGLIVLELSAVESDDGTSRTASGTTTRRLSLARLALMLGQLASILRAGMPQERALEACERATAAPAEKAVLAALRSDVLAGFPLSEAMRRQRRVFDAFCVAAVRAGERAGRLDQVIAGLADHLERRQAIAQKIKLALIYPTLLVAVSLLIIVGLMQFVIPQVAAVFAHNKQGLPLLTRSLLGLTDALRAGGLWLLAGLIGGGVVLAKIAPRLPQLKARRQRFLLGLPFIGPVLQDGDVARVVATLGLLTNSGVPLVTALQSACEVADFSRTRQAFADAAEVVEQGSSLQRALENAPGIPPLIPLLIGSGEESGALPAMLEEGAQRLNSSVEVRIDAMLRIFEPAVVLVMGGAVLLIVLAVLLPIFEMNQLVK